MSMPIVLQKCIPFDPMSPRPLPGIQPLDPDDWLLRDDAFAAQMALRDRLLETRREAVVAMAEEAGDAAQELLDEVLERAYGGATDRVVRPDGVTVGIDRDDPMGTLGRLVQEDLCILQKSGDEHMLTAATLCFPASWTLAEKFMKPMLRIHRPVDSYDATMARRVQRLFDGVQPGRPLWRFNAFWYEDPALFHPRREADPRSSGGGGDYLRSERQCILRLPRSRAAIFSIHTYVLARRDVAGRA